MSVVLYRLVQLKSKRSPQLLKLYQWSLRIQWWCRQTKHLVDDTCALGWITQVKLTWKMSVVLYRLVQLKSKRSPQLLKLYQWSLRIQWWCRQTKHLVRDTCALGWITQVKPTWKMSVVIPTKIISIKFVNTAVMWANKRFPLNEDTVNTVVSRKTKLHLFLVATIEYFSSREFYRFHVTKTIYEYSIWSRFSSREKRASAGS